jgi:hypothetical protein
MNNSDNSVNYSRKQKKKFENNEFELKTSGLTESVWYDEISHPMKFDK